MKEHDGGCWIDEPTRKMLIELLKTAKHGAQASGHDGGPHGDIGRIDDVLIKLARKHG